MAAELRLAQQDGLQREARPSTVMLDSMRSSSSAASDRFCASSTTSRQRRPAGRWSRTMSSKRRSSVALSSPAFVDPEIGHRQAQQVVARDLRGDDAGDRIGVAVELRPELLDQRGLAGADLAGDDDEALLLRQPVDQVRDRPAVPAGAEEEPAVGRQLERDAGEIVEVLVHGDPIRTAC